MPPPNPSASGEKKNHGNVLLWVTWSSVGVLALSALVFVFSHENNTDKTTRLQRQAESQIQENDFRSAQATLKKIPDGYAGNARPLIDQVNAELAKQRLAGERRKEEEKQRLIAVQKAEEERRRDDERRLDARAKPSQKSEPTNLSEQAKTDKFAVGNRLTNPETPNLSYDTIISRIAGSVTAKSYNKYKDSKDKTDEYREDRVNFLRGFIFEAAVTTEANDHLALTDRNKRFLMTSMEGAHKHQADVILWKDGVIKKLYQVKSKRSPNDIADALHDDRYIDMAIIIHPEVLKTIKQTLKKKKQRGKPLDWKMEILDEAIESGLLSDSVVDCVPAPSYEEMHDKADQVIRQQMQVARDQWE